MTSKKTYRLFIPLLIGTVFLFLLDLIIGSIRIPFSEIINILTGNTADPIHTEILLNFRVPKAISAILAGASLSVAGLLMQTLFR
ncbi:MAG: iron chelate uptake ABC transporter family permease subunit, partial [Paludibacter sp.]|nr:iron chelate uptake ABC transporter family permease subunit [Paludibacter sp.]